MKNNAKKSSKMKKNAQNLAYVKKMLYLCTVN